MIKHVKRHQFKFGTVILAIAVLIWPSPYMGLDLWIAYMIAYVCDEIRAGELVIKQ